ncbi:MAG: DeoR family transcriptional regulator [Streptosporangiales bacterium]|nr:DeoR family transcriptional regulator [Streptosporangiales bacterium]
MLARQRQEHILEAVRRHGAVRVSELVDSLGVSDMTVRRDLDALSGRGLVEKVHGGAVSVHRNTTDEPSFAAKSNRQLPEKTAIARAAAELVEPGMAVGLSAGTTTWSLATRLAEIGDLTVVTNSIRVAEVLHARSDPSQTVVLIGGIRTPSDALVGPLAVAAIRSLHLDAVFMGVHGIDGRSGLMTPNLMEAETNRALVESARRLVVLCDHTKWGTVGISSFARLDEVDVLITDPALDPDARRQLEDQVGRLEVAVR